MEMARFALQALRAARAGAQVLPAPPPDPAFVGDASLEYAGVYMAPRDGGAERDERDRVELVARQGRLHLRSAGGDGIDLERRGDDLFLAPHPDWDLFYVRFERDDGGACARRARLGSPLARA